MENKSAILLITFILFESCHENSSTESYLDPGLVQCEHAKGGGARLVRDFRGNRSVERNFQGSGLTGQAARGAGSEKRL